MENELITTLNSYAEINLPTHISSNELEEKLKQHINHLIKSDFEKLVTLLYRIDVSEKKLKELLQQNANKDAAEIIAKLIIERQLEKIKTRNQFKQGDNISEEEKW
jgi:hypothetical protein